MSVGTLGALSWPCVSCLQSSWFLGVAGGVASGICHLDSMKVQERQPPVLNITYRCQMRLKENRTVQLQSRLLVGAREGIEKRQGNGRKNSIPCLGTHLASCPSAKMSFQSVIWTSQGLCDTKWSIKERRDKNRGAQSRDQRKTPASHTLWWLLAEPSEMVLVLRNCDLSTQEQIKKQM